MATMPEIKRAGAPDICAGAEQEGVDEGQHHAGREQPVGARQDADVRVVDPMDPACVQIEEIEDDVADIGDRQHEQIVRHQAAGRD